MKYYLNSSFAAFLDRSEFVLVGNPLSRWVLALLVFAGLFLLLLIFRRFIKGYLRRLTLLTSNTLDDLVVDVLSRTGIWFFLIVSVCLSSRLLHLSRFSGYFTKLLTLAIFVQIGVWLTILFRGLLVRFGRRHSSNVKENAAMVMLHYVGVGVIWILILIAALDNMGVKVVSLLAGLGVGGIAVALAVQKILGDLLASVSIILDKPFQVGDFIVVGDYSGTVEHIGLKTTHLRSNTGEQIVISNGDLLESRLRNMKRMSERRNVMTVGVTYQTSVENLRRIPGLIQEIVENEPLVRFERAHFKSMEASALVFECVYWIKEPAYLSLMEAQQNINLKIVESFNTGGIDFAYPTQTLIIDR